MLHSKLLYWSGFGVARWKATLLGWPAKSGLLSPVKSEDVRRVNVRQWVACVPPPPGVKEASTEKELIFDDGNFGVDADRGIPQFSSLVFKG